MVRWSVRRPWPAILAIVLLASACATGTPSATPTRTAVGSSGPAGPSTAVAPPSTGPVQPSPTTPRPSSDEPPPAALAAEGGDPVDGELGSFTWGDGGSDSPWLPGSPITVGSGERLTATIAGVGVGSWSASRVPSGTDNGFGAVPLGSGSAAISFTAPEPGSWSVQITVQFAGDLGSASYYWHLTVR
jgi:hypothetical protein